MLQSVKSNRVRSRATFLSVSAAFFALLAPTQFPHAINPLSQTSIPKPKDTYPLPNEPTVISPFITTAKLEGNPTTEMLAMRHNSILNAKSFYGELTTKQYFQQMKRDHWDEEREHANKFVTYKNEVPSFDIKRNKYELITTPWLSFFNKRGHARVLLETDPPGARVFAFNISHFQPEPESEDLIKKFKYGTPPDLGVSPLKTWVRGGHYFVIAVWPDGKFSEVYREVPNPQVEGDSHFCVPGGWQRTEEGIVLKPIAYVEPDVEKMGLAFDFWFERQARFPDNLKFWRSIVVDLEQKGMRLPFHSELESAGIRPANREWTMTYHAPDSRRMLRNKHENGSKFRLSGKRIVPLNRWAAGASNIETKKFHYRGIRRKHPFIGVSF